MNLGVKAAKFSAKRRVSGKRTLKDLWIVKSDLHGTIRCMNIKGWINLYPDDVMRAIWNGKLEITGDAHKLLMKELAKRFPELVEINLKKKQDHLINQTFYKKKERLRKSERSGFVSIHKYTFE